MQAGTRNVHQGDAKYLQRMQKNVQHNALLHCGSHREARRCRRTFAVGLAAAPPDRRTHTSTLRRSAKYTKLTWKREPRSITRKLDKLHDELLKLTRAAKRAKKDEEEPVDGEPLDEEDEKDLQLPRRAKHAAKVVKKIKEQENRKVEREIAAEMAAKAPAAKPKATPDPSLRSPPPPPGKHQLALPIEGGGGC